MMQFPKNRNCLPSSKQNQLVGSQEHIKTTICLFLIILATFTGTSSSSALRQYQLRQQLGGKKKAAVSLTNKKQAFILACSLTEQDNPCSQP